MLRFENSEEDVLDAERDSLVSLTETAADKTEAWVKLVTTSQQHGTHYIYPQTLKIFLV